MAPPASPATLFPTALSTKFPICIPPGAAMADLTPDVKKSFTPTLPTFNNPPKTSLFLPCQQVSATLSILPTGLLLCCRGQGMSKEENYCL